MVDRVKPPHIRFKQMRPQLTIATKGKTRETILTVPRNKPGGMNQYQNVILNFFSDVFFFVLLNRTRFFATV